jgi:hypothetical protein
MNKKLLVLAQDDWSDEKIQQRTTSMIDAILSIWKVPENHTVVFNSPKQEERVYIEIADLLEFGSLQPGQILYPKRKKYSGTNAEILQDGRIAIGDSIFVTPSGASDYLCKKSTNGWRFWLISQDPMKSLSEVRTEYRDSLSLDSDDLDSDVEDSED